jgi:Tol biopolymer transport system component
MLRQSFLLATLLGAPAVLASAQDSPFKQVFVSDSMDVASPTASPDGKWLLLTRFLSEQERQLVIRPMAGGPIRILPTPKGATWDPMFTPAGDRLVAVSTMPRRGDADDGIYLVSAGFDTRTGTLTSPLRQISLDPIRVGGRRMVAVSPDGKWVAYVALPGLELRIVPVAGGTPRTLVSRPSLPSALAWSKDAQSVIYTTRGADPADTLWTRMQVGIGGGAPNRVFSARGRNLAVESGDTYSFIADRFSGARDRWTLRILGPSGDLIGEVPSPAGIQGRLVTVRDRQYLLYAKGESVAPMMLVPVAGGPGRQVGDETCYNWPAGWSADGSRFYVEPICPKSPRSVNIVDLEGRTRGTIPMTQFGEFISERNGHVLLRNGHTADSTSNAFVSLDLRTGARRILTGPTVWRGAPLPPGGMYWSMVGEEFYYRQLAGDRVQIRAITATGSSRLIAELPVRGGTLYMVGVFKNRVAYLQGSADSVPLKVRNADGPEATLGWFKVPGIGFSTLAWSRDGRQLALATSDPEQRLVIFRFDTTGAMTGPPKSIVPPFEYFYEIFWLADGSGFTMIAQPRGAPKTDVAVVRIADPDRPTLLTKDDPHSMWGHALSPDGKYVVYPSERSNGSSVYMVSVDDLLKAAKKP